MTRDDKDEAEGTGRTGGGGISIGSISGGAVAQGERAKAEDRSERVGQPEAPPAGGAAPVPPPGNGGMAVGAMSGGALAQGREAQATDASRQLVTATPELLAAVARMREELAVQQRTAGDGLDEVDAELAAVQREAEVAGRTGRSRLARLRTLLTSGATAVGGLASLAAVVEAISRLVA
ncbi:MULTISPECIES: hypothetical protein [Streptomyces]|uniref:DUF3618 domain-containing protein n=1 Tax=Streptomyces luteosporeus TaxID=173856 RepID=A0ABN3TJ77_9ACTN